jgi:hypothetical protein
MYGIDVNLDDEYSRFETETTTSVHPYCTRERARGFSIAGERIILQFSLHWRGRLTVSYSFLNHPPQTAGGEEEDL